MKQFVKHFTKSEWERIPQSKKGRIGSAVRYTQLGSGKYTRSGRNQGLDRTDFKSLNRYTLKLGNRMLVEGIGFTIEGRGTHETEFSLI